MDSDLPKKRASPAAPEDNDNDRWLNPKAPARPRKADARKGDGPLAWVRDIVIAGAAVALVIGSIFIYSGTWPPMVVIESGSMMHSPDRSMLGVIDTGDLTLVKRVDSRADIITYFEGQRRNYETYSNYGDVLIYAKNGHKELTPIIHRAITWIEFNTTSEAAAARFTHCTVDDNSPICVSGINSTWDFPDLPVPQFAVPVRANLSVPHLTVSVGPVRSWHGGSGGAEITLQIDLTALAIAESSFHHSGFITKGDNNCGPDEFSAVCGGGLTAPPVGGPSNCQSFGNGTPCVPVQPVLVDWVVGKAQGELPWFGVIKLWAGGAKCPPTCIPGNSAVNLIVAIGVIAVGPFLVEKVWGAYGDRVTDRVPKRWRDGWHRGWDKLPGGNGRAERRRERSEELAVERKRRGGRRPGGRAR